MGVPVNPHPSDEDLEWPYPSCLLCGKKCFSAFHLIANYRCKWYVAKSNYVAMKIGIEYHYLLARISYIDIYQKTEKHTHSLFFNRIAVKKNFQKV